GARAEHVEFVAEGKTSQANGREFAGPVNIVRRATLGEISFVVLGADENTSAQIAAVQEESPVDTPAHAAPSPESHVAAIRAAAAAEVERIATIRKLCAGQHAEIEAQAIAEGWDPTRTELALLRASRPQGPYLVRGAVHDRFGPAQLLEAALALNRPFARLERHYPADLLQAADGRHGRRLKLREAIYLVAQANGYAGSPFLDAHSLGEAMRYAWTLPMTVRAVELSTSSLPAIMLVPTSRKVVAQQLITETRVTGHPGQKARGAALAVVGVFDFAKAAEALAVGAIVYWDNVAKVVTTTAAGNKLVGKSLVPRGLVSKTLDRGRRSFDYQVDVAAGGLEVPSASARGPARPVRHPTRTWT
ncbi:MAG: DUF2190 family protein, partial [Gemmataceae bacterium]|nr:DUF2190 family protein [Gemmataceae bacterium]